MSRTPSLNGEFNGMGPYRPGPSRHANAWPSQTDPAEAADIRRLDREAWSRLAPVAVDAIEGYGCLTADELGEQRELELAAAADLEAWGCNPFEED